MENKIKEAIQGPLNNEEIILSDVYFGYEDNVKTLFVVVDNKNKVDLELCVKATEIVNPIIDDLDLDVDNYVLDVSGKVKGEENE